jgi:hypothetical protein
MGFSGGSISAAAVFPLRQWPGRPIGLAELFTGHSSGESERRISARSLAVWFKERDPSMSQVSSLFELPSPQELVEDIKFWIQEKGPWWATSVTAHAVILSSVLLLAGSVVAPKKEGDAPLFEATADPIAPDAEIEHFELGEAPEQATELSTDTLMMETPTVTEQINTNANDPFEEAGGGMGSAATSFGGGDGFEIKGMSAGPAMRNMGGIGGQGESTKPGSGGKGEGFGSRGSGVRKAMLGHGGTKASERAVAAALNWLARHQGPDGNWSLSGYTKMCKDGSCAGKAQADSDSAATAMALLPFLAAGQTHKSKGPYKKNIYAGLYWLIRNQSTDGDLSAKSPQRMYTHGLATICLCEAYGLSGDTTVGGPAQQAINFICKSQNAGTGGWRYNPGEPGDTSVVGWQVMGLKSGLMAGLEVPSPVIEGAHKWLKSCASGKGGLFSYEVAGGATPTMSSVGLLCSQYLGMQKQDPAMVEGVGYLMANMPDMANRNTYYWYYATQVMHNVPGYDWDNWNRKMRKLLIESQVRKGCAEGSWDPSLPAKDVWGEHGGRIMMTSLSALTLEVYYRYLPLYKLDGKEEKK